MERLKRLTQLMEISGLTLTEVSRRSGVNMSTCHRYVRGTAKRFKELYYNPIYDVLKEWETHNEEPEKVKLNDPEFKTESEIKDESLIIDVDKLKTSMMGNGLSHTTLSAVSVKDESKEIKEEPKDVSRISKIPSSHTYQNNTMNTTYSIPRPKRREIWYVRNMNASGNETAFDRPGIVISSDKLNGILGTVMMVFLTTQYHNESPFHVSVKTNKPISIALCEKVNSVSVNKLTTCIGSITEIEMQLVEKAVCDAMGIKKTITDVSHSADYIALQTEVRILRKFYDDYINIQMKS